MIDEKEKTRDYRFARTVLSPEFDSEKVASILESMKWHFTDIEPTVPELKAPSSRMTIKIGPGVVAFYRSLPADLSEEIKRDLVKLFVNEYMQGQFEMPAARFVWGSRILHRLYRRLWILSANWYDEPAGWRFRFIPSEGDLYYGMDVTRCGLVSFMKDQDLTELTPLICQGDHQAQAYLPQGVVFERSQTIAEGFSFCNFRYVNAD